MNGKSNRMKANRRLFTKRQIKLIAAVLDGQSVFCPPERITGTDKTLFMLGAHDQKEFYVKALAGFFGEDYVTFSRLCEGIVK